MLPTLLAHYPDGHAEVHTFTSKTDRDRLYFSMRSFGGPDRLAQSDRATLDDGIQHAERVWGADRVEIIRHA